MTLADRLVVLNAGVIEQEGAPLDVYDRPRSRFVAAFMGSPAMNFLPAKVEEGRVRAAGLDLPAPDRAGTGEVLVGIRPHDVSVSEGDEGGATLRVEVVEAMGFEAYAHGHVGEASFVARLEGDEVKRLSVGDEIHLTVPADAVHLFDPETEKAL